MLFNKRKINSFLVIDTSHSPDPVMRVGVCGLPYYIVKKYSMVWLRKIEREFLKEMTLFQLEKLSTTSRA